MKCEWRKVKLQDIALELSDGLHKAPIFYPGGEYIFVNATNIENGRIVEKDPSKKTNLEEFLKYGVELTDRTILYSIDGTIGNIAKYRGEKCLLGKGACYITLDNSVDLDYIYYLLQSPIFNEYIHIMSTGSTIKHISLKTMRNFTFQLPPIEQQKAIGSVLRSIDDKIELNNKINEYLQQQAQAIYQEWFGNINMEKEQGTLADICTYSKDRVSVSELDISTYFSTENMLPGKAGAVEASNLPTTAQTTACHVGDTLISNIRPYFKKIVYCHEECGCSTDVLCFVPVHPKYSAYLYSTLYADRFFDFMVAGSKGTKMPRGDKQQIMTYPVTLPIDTELERFNSVAVPILVHIQKNHNENKRLSSLRDTLLPKLISGEIKL